MDTINVRPVGAPVPLEGRREKITEAREVPDTAYYRRRILKGELAVVPPETKPRKLAQVPPAPPSDGGAK